MAFGSAWGVGEAPFLSLGVIMNDKKILDKVEGIEQEERQEEDDS